MLPYKGKATLIAPSVPQGDEGETWLKDFVRLCPKAECGWTALNLHCGFLGSAHEKPPDLFQGMRVPTKSNTSRSTLRMPVVTQPMAEPTSGSASLIRRPDRMQRRKSSIRMPSHG